MRSDKRWDPCVSHWGEEVTTFLRQYFSERERSVLLVAGAGFDPRSSTACRALVDAGAQDLSALLLREERPGAATDLRALAEGNVRVLLGLVPGAEVKEVQIFAQDGAVVGWKGAIDAARAVNLDGITDVFIDFSALSLGVAYPITRFFLEQCDRGACNANLHVLVTHGPAVDAVIHAHASDKAETLQGFDGGLGSEDKADAAKLWLPQLRRDRHGVLTRIFDAVDPDDVCPVLPFPSSGPRTGDELIEHYADFFESTWRVQAHDIIYADERDPLDLYRAILEIDDVRARVFEQIGGSLTILSPIGSKVLSIGALMAAIERDFPVVYVEAISYEFDPSTRRNEPGAASLLHVLLAGDGYAGLKEESR